MPAVSKKQQKLMGAALHCKKTGDCASAEVRKVADSMSMDELEKFAGTSHKGLPEKVSERMSFKEFLLAESKEEENDE